MEIGFKPKKKSVQVVSDSLELWDRNAKIPCEKPVPVKLLADGNLQREANKRHENQFDHSQTCLDHQRSSEFQPWRKKRHLLDTWMNLNALGDDLRTSFVAKCTQSSSRQCIRKGWRGLRWVGGSRNDLRIGSFCARRAEIWVATNESSHLDPSCKSELTRPSTLQLLRMSRPLLRSQNVPLL